MDKNATYTAERFCKDCGKRFIIIKSDYENCEIFDWELPKRCLKCRRISKAARQEQSETAKNANDRENKAEKQAEFERRLKSWSVVGYDEIAPIPGKTLYIIGNGFDMMHGADSRYISFRDSLGKSNKLRQYLETYITVEDIWADFESALAHINMNFFSGRSNVDNHLYFSGAYEKNASAADFYMATENATGPVTRIVNELPRRFYDWVSKLVVGTDDRPLSRMFGNGDFDDSKVLNFNYTEFFETLYGVPESNICYIHGCRKAKGSSRPRLILGHAAGASDEEFEKKDRSRADMRDPARRKLIYAARSVVRDQLVNCDCELTKDCAKIIKEHEAFFESIRPTELVVTIGHSLSEVDMPYFEEIVSRLDDVSSVQWCFGCFDLSNLENLERFVERFGLDRANIRIFRTDKIQVNIKPAPEKPSKVSEPKIRNITEFGKWRAQSCGNEIQIIEKGTGALVYSADFPKNISTLFFLKDTGKLFLISNDYAGILAFGIKGGVWQVLYELENNSGRGLLTRSLDRIVLSGDRLAFIYNNRVREYSLENGKITRSESKRGMKDRKFSGEDVMELFKRTKR